MNQWHSLVIKILVIYINIIPISWPLFEHGLMKRWRKVVFVVIKLNFYSSFETFRYFFILMRGICSLCCPEAPRYLRCLKEKTKTKKTWALDTHSCCFFRGQIYQGHSYCVWLVLFSCLYLLVDMLGERGTVVVLVLVFACLTTCNPL